MGVALFQRLPYLFGLWFGEAIVEDVASDEDDALLEEQFWEECKHTIGLCIGSALLKILQVGAQLANSIYTKQSFCH